MDVDVYCIMLMSNYVLVYRCIIVHNMNGRLIVCMWMRMYMISGHMDEYECGCICMWMYMSVDVYVCGCMYMNICIYICMCIWLVLHKGALYGHISSQLPITAGWTAAFVKV